MMNVMNPMEITWICKFCGAINTTPNNSCTECSAAYSSPVPQEPVVNQALLNQGVIFNNTVFAPPSYDDMLHSLEECYPIEEEEKTEKPKESVGMRLFILVCNLWLWFGLLVASSVFLFFVWVVIKAYG
jgi:hypothetical protein